ncbi:hypothetical protein WN944_025798 [Citrus x changshan-huyou]|uniref:Uncharacterized protein n=1 Tax=Citrus x changshan-huyou TaxID=2935761 RepID=A0AAP0LRU4_9ROSI
MAAFPNLHDATQANLSDADPDEIALRLEISGYDPQWAVK